MTYILDDRTKKEIRTEAQCLQVLGEKDSPFHVMEEAARRLLKGHLEWVEAYHINDLYRGHIWKESTLPVNVSRLLALPAGKVEKYGRLNTPGQSLLYVSELTQTVLNELRVEAGNEVVILRLIKNDNSPSLYVSFLGILPQNTDYSSLTDREKEVVAIVGGGRNYKKLIEMRRCISKLFKAPVSKENSHLYKITAALGHNHFSADEIHGLIYPSITTKYATCNLALKPSVVGSHFKPHSVAWLKIKKRDWDHHHVDTLKTGWVDGSGKIIWDDSIVFESPQPPGAEFVEE